MEVFRRAADSQVLLLIDHLGESLSNDGMIIDQKNPVFVLLLGDHNLGLPEQIYGVQLTLARSGLAERRISFTDLLRAKVVPVSTSLRQFLNSGSKIRRASHCPSTPCAFVDRLQRLSLACHFYRR